MAYGKYKNLAKRTESDKVVRDKAFKIASNPKYNGYERVLVSMVCSSIKFMLIQQLADELHKPTITKRKRRRFYSSFKYNIFGGGDLTGMQLISKYNKWIRFLLCAIDLLSKYFWVVSLKEKKGVTIVNAFKVIFDSSKRKPNKRWVDQGSEFYNSLKKWLEDNDIEMYST